MSDCVLLCFSVKADEARLVLFETREGETPVEPQSDWVGGFAGAKRIFGFDGATWNVVNLAVPFVDVTRSALRERKISCHAP